MFWYEKFLGECRLVLFVYVAHASNHPKNPMANSAWVHPIIFLSEAILILGKNQSDITCQWLLHQCCLLFLSHSTQICNRCFHLLPTMKRSQGSSQKNLVLKVKIKIFGYNFLTLISISPIFCGFFSLICV